MKFCNVCGNEISTRDGDNTCFSCESLQDGRKIAALAKRSTSRKERENVLRDLGLVKVRGAMGGVYWE